MHERVATDDCDFATPVMLSTFSRKLSCFIFTSRSFAYLVIATSINVKLKRSRCAPERSDIGTLKRCKTFHQFTTSLTLNYRN